MFDETGGMSGCLGMIGVIIALVVVLVLVGGQTAALLRDAGANADAKAARLELAKAERERIAAEARVELERARGESWEHRFMLWSAFIEANDDDAPLIVGAVLGAVLVFVGGLAARKLFMAM